MTQIGLESEPEVCISWVRGGKINYPRITSSFIIAGEEIVEEGKKTADIHPRSPEAIIMDSVHRSSICIRLPKPNDEEEKSRGKAIAAHKASEK